MGFEPVPSWYFITIVVLISFFCGWSSIRIIRIFRDDANLSIDRFAHEMLNLCDENDQDQLDEIEKLKIRTAELERMVMEIWPKFRAKEKKTLKTSNEEKDTSQP